jgi:3-hydroxypropanoate dehydrogenase
MGSVTTFPGARPPSADRRWAAQAISRDALDELHALLALGPGLADASPTRILFLNSAAAKARLAPHLNASAAAEALPAPACAVIGYDQGFAEQLAELLPQPPGRPSCLGRPETVRRTAVRHGALQAAYLAVAAQALGLAIAPVSGFDPAGVSQEFFRNGRIRARFLCALGYPAA